VGALRREGPSTATALAAALGTNSGATSYHLRKLESVGLVEDTGEGEGKRRLWRASATYTSWQPSDFEGDEDSETALNWLTRDYARHFSEQYERWLDVSTTWPTSWQDACGSTDASILVTPEALESMRAEMWELVQRYRRVGQGNPQARRVAVYAFAYPLDLERPPSGGGSGPGVGARPQARGTRR
jgi:DNA-binding transcriptional ArsR family regulator